ncbi:hypothetical protein CRYUN_Cryun15aG0078500 [Craigia yunnanensis]
MPCQLVTNFQDSVKLDVPAVKLGQRNMMKTVTVKIVPGIAKVAGILVCMAGVITLAFYKGPVLKPLFHLHNFQPQSGGQDDHHASSGKTWILGCFLLLVFCICWGLWLVVPAQVLKSYPSKFTFTSILYLSTAVQSFLVAIALERDPHQWKLGWNFRLLAVDYCVSKEKASTIWRNLYII